MLKNDLLFCGWGPYNQHSSTLFILGIYSSDAKVYLIRQKAFQGLKKILVILISIN